jgi:hypothetical protein
LIESLENATYFGYSHFVRYITWFTRYKKVCGGNETCANKIFANQDLLFDKNFPDHFVSFYDDEHSQTTSKLLEGFRFLMPVCGLFM